jgi:transcriptional regulator with XRE-family HTH domain
MEIDMKGFAKRVRSRRKELGWTEQHLADRAGVDDSSIQYYESGNLKAPEKVSRKLAAALEVTEDWLLFDKGGPPSPPPELTPGQIADYYASLPKSERQRLSQEIMGLRKSRQGP